MPMSNYPGGFSSGVSIRGMTIMNCHSGNTFWVDSGTGSDSGGYDGSFQRPFATVDYAVSRCTANNGDLVMVKAGHAETLSANVGIDVAGVWVQGLGWGAVRPTFTIGSTDATVALSAASTGISNFRLVLEAADDTVTAGFTMSAASTVVENCETVVHATAQFTTHLTATDVANIEIIGNRFASLHTASSTSGVVLDGCDDVQMHYNYISGHFSEHALDNTTPAACDEILRAFITHNTIRNWSATAGDLAIELDDNATGIMAYNNIIGGLARDANVNYGNMQMIENYLTDSADTTAVVHPITTTQ